MSIAYVDYQHGLTSQALKRILKPQEASFIAKLFLTLPNSEKFFCLLPPWKSQVKISLAVEKAALNMHP